MPNQGDQRDDGQAAAPGCSADEYRQRLERVQGRVTALFTTLYGSHPDGAAQLGRLLDVVRDAALTRPASLVATDRACEAASTTPLGFGRVGYSCYVDRFAGTLGGIVERIPYLRELGVTYLHLLPFWRRRPGDNDGGFAVSDMVAVEPSLGTVADLERLATALAAAGIMLCGDFVLNHVADDHAWAQAARAGDPEFADFFHVFPDRAQPDAFEQSLPQVFPQTAPGNFTEVPNLGWVWTTFYPYQWDLNWHNPAVFVAVSQSLLSLANLGVAAFRLDSAPFLWKRQGTTCQGQPETHLILRLIRAILAIAAPAVVLKAEAVVPASQLPAYFGVPDHPGEECHIAYHTSLMAALWSAVGLGDTALLRQVVADTPALGEAGTWLTYVRCHDDIGWSVLREECAVLGDPPGQERIRTAARFLGGGDPRSFARGQAFQSNGLISTNGMTASLLGIEAARALGDPMALARAADRVVLLYAVIFAFGGLPVIYMGDELGQTNAIPDPVEIDGRWLHRPGFDVQAAALRAVEGTVEQRLFQAFRQLGARAPALGQSPVSLIAEAPPPVLALARGPDRLALFNFADAPVACDSIPVLAQARWTDLQSSCLIEPGETLAGWGFRWLMRTV